jgi:hypothetical protein
MPTLAELRAQSGPQPLPRSSKVVTLIEGQHLLAESEALAEELLTIAREASRTDTDGERTGPPRKAGEGANLGPRAEEIKARQDAILDELANFQGEVGLQGVTGGEWQRFKDENPPRKDNANDARWAGGNCDSAALFAALGRFVRSWDGEPVTAADWDDWLAERITYADRRDLVPAVVQMHEQGLARSPKFRSASPTISPSATG